jgi:hypothetical protein
MWPNSYFPSSFFPGNYWAKIGQVGGGGGGGSSNQYLPMVGVGSSLIFWIASSIAFAVSAS